MLTEKKPYQKFENKTTTPIIGLEKGKIPPQAIDLEEVILGAMMIDKRGLPEVMHLLSEEVFYKEKHGLIFKAIREIYLKKDSVDLLTVINQLKENSDLDQAGGEYYLVGLTQKISSSAHIEFHTRIVLQKFIQRQLIKNSNEVIQLAYDETIDVFDLLDDAYSKLNEVSEVSVKPEEVMLGSLINPQIEKGQQIFNQEIKPGIETPIKRLTRKAGGWRNSELIILAARPGMGKTALAISYGIHAAKMGVPTAFFSLEMSKEQLTNRIISSEARIDNQKFTVQGLDPEDARRSREASKMINSIPFFIDDTPAISIEQFQIKAKRMASRYGIKFILVDYLQLMTASNGRGNREQEISKISRGLKLIAKSLDIPVIALSQLSRAVETRGGSKRPQLSDLRESGAIEQDADVVQFIYRPEYYGIDEWDDYEGPTVDEAEYIVAKNRNGGLVRNRMAFEKTFTLFSDLDDDDKFFNKLDTNALPSADEAFGEAENKDIDDVHDDLPF